MQILKKIVFSMVLALLPAFVHAWPNRAVTIIVPFPPGGLTDQIVRALSTELETQFKTTTIIKHLPGGNHLVALSSVFKDADDHTFIIADAGLASGGYWINPDVVKQFKMINVLGSVPIVFSGGSSASLQTLKKQLNSGRPINVASTGADSAQYLWIAGLDNPPAMNPIYYKGGNPAMTDLAGGHVDYAVMSLTLTHQFAINGRVVPLAISTDKRHVLMPDVPTFKEIGWRGESANFWYGFLAPIKTNEQSAKIFNAAIARALETKAVKKLEDSGFIINLISGPAAQSFFEKELEKYNLVRKRLKIQQ